MGQGDIYNYLIKHRGKKITVKNLAKALGVNRSTITLCLNRLMHGDFYKVKQDKKILELQSMEDSDIICRNCEDFQ